MQEQVNIRQVISNRKYSWYDKIREGKEMRSKVDRATPDISEANMKPIKPINPNKTDYEQIRLYRFRPRLHEISTSKE